MAVAKTSLDHKPPTHTVTTAPHGGTLSVRMTGHSKLKTQLHQKPKATPTRHGSFRLCDFTTTPTRCSALAHVSMVHRQVPRGPTVHVRSRPNFDEQQR